MVGNHRNPKQAGAKRRKLCDQSAAPDRTIRKIHHAILSDV